MNFGVRQFGASSFGAARFGAGRFGTVSGGLTKAALIARLTTFGALALFMPSNPAAVYKDYRAMTGLSTPGTQVGLILDELSGQVKTPLWENPGFSGGGAGWLTSGAVTFESDGVVRLTGSGFLYRTAGIGHIGKIVQYTIEVLESSTPYPSFSNLNGVPYAQFLGLTTPTTITAALRYTATTNATFGAGFSGSGVSRFKNPMAWEIEAVPAMQPTESNRPNLRYTGGLYYLDPTSGQGLTAYLPASVGGTVTAVYANPGVGAMIVTGVTVTSQAVWLPYKHSGLVIMPSTASAEAVAAVAAMVDVLARRVV